MEVILEVRNELLENNQQDEVWEGWTGDPCLPVPWNGIGCETVNGDTVITKLYVTYFPFFVTFVLNCTSLQCCGMLWGGKVYNFFGYIH